MRSIRITSAHNPKVQRVRTLLEKRKEREAQQVCVVEGVRLTEEALAAGWPVETVFYSSQLSARGQELLEGLETARAELIEIPPSLMDNLAGTETPQGVLAVFAVRPPPLPDQLDFVLIADNLRDPGNLGTLLRTAAAAGVQAALLAPGTTDAFAPKVLRAGMGAHFRLPTLHLGWDQIRAACKDQPHPLRVLMAEPAAGADCWDLDLRQPLALLVGSEADGPSPDGRALADQPVAIPMPGASESLNAAVAAGILLFEVVRQRR
jgi:TrmH family RNA methyltransferase